MRIAVQPFWLPLLQTRYEFLAAPDRQSTWIFVVVAAVLVVVFIFGAVFMRRGNRSLDPRQRQRHGRRVFHKTAKNIGLQKYHVAILEQLLKATKVRQPFLVFSSSSMLDDVLKKGIYALRQNTAMKPEDRERHTNYLFQIKQIIERNARSAAGIKSTATLKLGQPVEIATEKGDRFESRVVSNMRHMLALEAPERAGGGALRWSRGTRVKVTFWRESDAGYTFDTKLLGHDTLKGTPAMLVHHAKTLRRAQQRRFKRSSLNRPCFFYPIQIVTMEGRRSERRAVVQQNMRLLGNLLDISAGGCSISSLYPLKPGSLCKIEFELGRKQHISIFGKVQRVRRQSSRGGIMHIMFTKMSTAFLNQIYLYVYDYSPPKRFVPAMR
jgi:c-di-GMP-binding flagellar brake protein YcgR